MYGFPHFFRSTADESNGKETDSSDGEYQYASICQYRVHATIIHISVKARLQEDHIGGNGIDPELRVFARRKSHVSCRRSGIQFDGIPWL